jgi:ArsR family transcriptional regulator
MADVALFIDGCQYIGMSERRVLPTVEPPTTGPEACSPSVFAAPLAEHEAVDVARAFAALADPARLRLFSLIAAQPQGEVCACALVEPLGRSQPTVSHHLRVLHEAGLVDREKRGTWVWYRARPGRLEALRSILASTSPTALT